MNRAQCSPEADWKYARAPARICSYNPKANSGALPMSHPRITAALVGAVLGLTAADAWAGPCSSDIAQFDAPIAQSKGNPYAGLSARQTVGADLNHQPTQASVAQAQARLP